MIRHLVLSALALVSLNASAAVNLNAETLAKLSPYFTQMHYVGVTPKGELCKVDVAKMGLGNNLSQIYVSGFDRFPMPGSTIFREVGFFSLATDMRWFKVQKAEFGNELVQVQVYQPNATDPVIYGIGEWTGLLSLRPSASGKGLGSVQIDESWYDPTSNATSTRSFFCGEPQQ